MCGQPWSAYDAPDTAPVPQDTEADETDGFLLDMTLAQPVPQDTDRLTPGEREALWRACSPDTVTRTIATVERILADRLAARDRDHEAEVATALALADEWDETSATGHPNCQHSEDCVGCAAEELRAALARTYGAARAVGEEADRG